MGKINLSTYNEGYAEFRIPGIICTDKDTLLAYCEGRCGKTDWGKIEILLWRSEAPKGGEDRTWSQYSVLVPSENEETVNNANMISDDNMVHFIYHTDYRRVFYMRSTDDGLSWTSPREITDTFKDFEKQMHGVVNASGPSHGIKMSTGRLIMPIWVGGNEDDPQAHWPSKAGVIYSDDRGDTWKAGALFGTELTALTSETVAAELSDGSLMLNTRNDSPKGCRLVAISRDGGETLESTYFDEGLRDPGCSAGMTSYNGKLYFSSCNESPNDGDSRVNLEIKESSDDGKTWSKICDVEKFGGYSDVAIDSKGRIYCFYEGERPEPYNESSFPQLHLTVFDMQL